MAIATRLITNGILFSIALTFASTSLYATTERIRYPQAGDIFQDHHRYPIALLKLALSYSKQNFAVEPSEHFMTQGRAIKQLNLRQGVDVLWTMTSLERESVVQAIRIPIYKGLIGWRLFLTTQEKLALEKTSPLKNRLNVQTFIQGHDWPDTDILEFNGFNVHSGTDYLGLFKILSLGRADLFPRSVIEIWDELKNRPEKNIVLEPSTVISYPTATYFFVAKSNKRLAEIIEKGLQAAIDDGNFNKLFKQYYQTFITRAELDKRTHLRLINPLLPKETPLHNKKLWFSLDHD